MLLAAAAAAPPPSSARAAADLITEADYPRASRRKGEEGTVTVRLDVTPRGRVGRCTVVQSSGFARLDAATCRVIGARARFTPARDARGHAVADSVTTRVAWRLTDNVENPALTHAIRLWMFCLGDAARPLARTGATEVAIMDQSFSRCLPQEAEVLARAAQVPGSGPTTSEGARKDISRLVLEMIVAMRSEPPRSGADPSR